MPRIPGGLLPAGQRLARWLEHYGECNECGVLPHDADDLETGDLCELGTVYLAELDYEHQLGLVQLGIAHKLAGAELQAAGEPQRIE